MPVLGNAYSQGHAVTQKVRQGYRVLLVAGVSPGPR